MQPILLILGIVVIAVVVVVLYFVFRSPTTTVTTPVNPQIQAYTIQPFVLSSSSSNVTVDFGSTPLPEQLVLKDKYLKTPCNCEEDPDAASYNATFESSIDTFIANCYKSSSSTSSIQTVLDTLMRSATQNSFATVNAQGYVVLMTKFLIPIHFFLLRVSIPIPPPILSWLRNLTSQVHTQFSARTNNLKMYSLLLETLEKLLAKSSPPPVNDARTIIQNSVDVSTGIISTELSRGAKADAYQEYAAQALVILACLLGLDVPHVHSMVTYTASLKLTTLRPWLIMYNKTFPSRAVAYTPSSMNAMSMIGPLSLI